MLLVRDNLHMFVQLQAGGSEVVAELVASDLSRRVVAAQRARLDQGDALLVVHDVERFALQGGGDRAAGTSTIHAVDLEAAQVDALFGERWGLSWSSIAFSDFAHALAACVVDVVGGLRRPTVGDSLFGGGFKLISIVPLHEGEMGHASHVTVHVVSIGLYQSVAKLGAAEAIAVFAIFKLALPIVAVGTRTAGIRGIGALVDHVQDVASFIVIVLLQVGTHGLAIAGLRVYHARPVIVTQRYRRLCLAQVFAPYSRNQAIDGVVGVVGARLDLAIVEVDGLLGVVLHVRDVADRVVGVG